MRRSRGIMAIIGALMCGHCLAAGLSDSSGAVTTDPFKRDLDALTAYPHRLAGSVEGQHAARYIESKLREAGADDILTLDIQVSQTRVSHCRLVAGHTSVELVPVRPNLTISPTTPPEGISGPLYYVGTGDILEYGPRNASGAIVAMEYDSRDNWRTAFSMGARAVIFLGNEHATSTDPKCIGIPANFLRLYATPLAQAAFNFRVDHGQVTLISHVPWERCPSRNIIAFLPGTQPKLSSEHSEPEAVVLSANYDTYGEIPTVSPGARSAANVAAVLDAVRYFKVHRPRRDLVFMFFDNQARFHEGARNVYDAIMCRADIAAGLAEEHRNERAFAQELMSSLERTDQARGRSRHDKEIIAYFKADAEHHSTELNQVLMALRTRLRLAPPDEQSRQRADIDSLGSIYSKWNDARVAISAGTIDAMDPHLLASLVASARQRVRLRLDELDLLVRADEQGAAIRERLSRTWIALHVSYDFSDAGPSWGLSLDDASGHGFSLIANAAADNPNHYGRVLRAVQEAEGALPGTALFARSVLGDPGGIAQYVPCRLITSNTTAGTYGIYNMSFTTYHDARPREGHPTDVVANLQWTRIRQQAREAHELLRALAGTASLSLPRVFGDNSLTKLPRWGNGKSTGYYVGLSVSGSIGENRPAAGALVLVGKGTKNWKGMGREAAAPGFDRFVLEYPNADGRFKLIGLRKDHFETGKDVITLVPVLFDSLGGVAAITNNVTMGTLDGVTMFPCKGYVVSVPLGGTPDWVTGTMQVLQGNADATFRADQSFSDVGEGFGFFYVHRNSTVDRGKVFQPQGAVYLGASPDDPYGKGFPLRTFAAPAEADRITAQDLWQLNEARLDILRSKGVTNVDLELLQSRAQHLLRAADSAADLGTKVASYAQSASTSRLIYNPIKEVMNDLIKAVVILLLLAIPFAFALERLIICATSIYARLAGFAAAFTITFALMYFMHPGFQIASAPLIVFLAFTIILLTILVTHIMVRKFRTEIMAMQGKSTGLHTSDVSRGGTLVAAVNMGMSTMRRRPVRTMLTCVTVVMLTFTILCFASLTNTLGVRSFYEGASSGDPAGSFLIHRLDCSALSANLPIKLRGREGAGGYIGEQWWLAKSKKSIAGALANELPFGIASVNNSRSAFVDGIVGISSEELRRWKQLASVLEGDSVERKCAALSKNGVYLPRVLADQLRLQVGDSLFVLGMRCFYAGYIDVGRLQRLKNLDGKSVLPVDFMDASYAVVTTQTSTGALATNNVSETAQKDFVRLNASQIAILPVDLVKRLGGTLHAISIYTGSDLGLAEEGRRLAELTGAPVWTRGKEGVERMVFTRVTEVSGGFALVIPIILGGLIIFGTLLGSISDRQKEIYTFSALGLSPGHVGFLFLAEAAVYAVIGGVGGQLLAQALALGASYLADLGYIQQPSINFSSTNSLFAIGMVMATVLVSAIYPAIQASKSANPGVQRSWKMPVPQGNELVVKFPFTVSAYDITGVVSFLAEHFREHNDAGLGLFAAENVRISRNASGNIILSAHLSLAPFDLGITEDFSIMAAPSEIEGIDEVLITVARGSGSVPDWTRASRTFIHALRKQFLLWRTLTPEVIESYRMATLQVLGEQVREPEAELRPAQQPLPGLGLAT